MSVRMRKKKNLVPRMERCSPVFVKEPGLKKGKWKNNQALDVKLSLEIGCGKGKFISETAGKNPGDIFVALERVPEALVMAMEKAIEIGAANLLYISGDAADLEEYFSPGELDMIYINFCDPWPKKRHEERRLVHRKFLKLYENLLSDNGEIVFKTDNRQLFEFALSEFSECGFMGIDAEYDLANSGKDNITTEYEDKFMALGMPIYRIEAFSRRGGKAGDNTVANN